MEGLDTPRNPDDPTATPYVEVHMIGGGYFELSLATWSDANHVGFSLALGELPDIHGNFVTIREHHIIGFTRWTSLGIARHRALMEG